MILFHGSNTVIDVVDLAKSKRYKDFGQAFYLSAEEDADSTDQKSCGYVRKQRKRIYYLLLLLHSGAFILRYQYYRCGAENGEKHHQQPRKLVCVSNGSHSLL